jgi:ADP-ribose pyrophosphatase YjhB (NUDIX family)
LLPKFGNKWLLPGGYIHVDESVDDAVKRILKECVGLEDAHLKFLTVVGGAQRRFRDEFKAFFDKKGFPWKEDYWFNNRFVTLAHYSLVNIEETHPKINDLYESFAWFNFDELPEMWMDHQTIALNARKRLKEDIQEEIVVYNLLPTEFTMPDLHQLYQSILEKAIDRSRFQKKMLSSGLFERLPLLKKETRGRNPYQYRLKEEQS